MKHKNVVMIILSPKNHGPNGSFSFRLALSSFDFAKERPGALCLSDDQSHHR